MKQLNSSIQSGTPGIGYSSIQLSSGLNQNANYSMFAEKRAPIFNNFTAENFTNEISTQVFNSNNYAYRYKAKQERLLLP